MFQRLFGRERSANRAITEALYASIVAAARQKLFYSDWNVPDTPLGRFEMLSLHMFLFQHRMRGEEHLGRRPVALGNNGSETTKARGIAPAGFCLGSLAPCLSRARARPTAAARRCW